MCLKPPLILGVRVLGDGMGGLCVCGAGDLGHTAASLCPWCTVGLD